LETFKLHYFVSVPVPSAVLVPNLWVGKKLYILLVSTVLILTLEGINSH